jgi:hypothetical protein
MFEHLTASAEHIQFVANKKDVTILTYLRYLSMMYGVPYLRPQVGSYR